MGGKGNFLMAVVGVALTVVTWGTTGFLATLGRSLLANVVLGAVGRAMAKKPSASAGATMSAQGRLETVRQPLAPRQVVYGRCRVGGILTFFETTTDNQTALMITTLTGHPVRAIRDVYFNDYTAADYGAAGSGAAAGGRFSGFANVYRSNGDEGAIQPFADLVARGLSWAATDLQRDCAKVHTTHAFSNEVWQSGLPQVSAVIDGVVDVIDPRLGSPTSSGWSNNPALCIAHYLASDNGLAVDYTSEVDQDALIAAANICDERVTLTGNKTSTLAAVMADAAGDYVALAAGQAVADYGDGVRFVPGSPGSLPGNITEGVTYYAIPLFDNDTTTGQRLRLATSHANAIAGVYIDITSAGSGTASMVFYDEPRYRLNGAFSLNEKPAVVLDRMLMAMAGKLVNSCGVWFIYAGAYTAPTLTFDEDDFAGPIQIQTNLSRRDNANAIKGTFVDPSSRYQPVDFPAVTSSTYLSEDGGERVWRDVDYTAFVTSSTQAQRLAKIDLITLRLGLTVRTRFKLSAFRMLTGTTVALTNTQMGWSAKAFEVANCALVIENDGRLEVDAILRETAAEVYDWSTSEEQLATLAPNTNLPDPTEVLAPTGLTFAQSETLPDRAALTWTAPADSFIRDYQVEYKLAADSDWIVRPRVEALRYDLEKAQPGEYDFRVAAINIFGASSSYATTTGTIVSARVTSSYTGSQDGLGVTQLLDTGSAGWALGTADVLSMAFCPANNKVYGTVEDDDPFNITPNPVSATPVLQQILNGKICKAVAYSPVTGYMYFTQSLTVGGSPSPTAIFAVNPANDQIVLTNSTMTDSMEFMIHCPSDGYLWGASTNDSLVYVIDPTDLSVVTTISVTQPKFMCYVPTTDQVWIGSYNTNRLTIIDISGSPTYNTLLVTTSASADHIEGIAYCSTEDRVIVSQDQEVLAFYNPATRTIASSVNLGNNTGQVFYNPNNDRIYVADRSTQNRIYTVVPRTLNYRAESLNVVGIFTEGCLNPLNNLLYFGTSNASVAVITT